MELIRYWRVMRRWAWLIILCPFIAGLAAGVVSLELPKVYEAKGKARDAMELYNAVLQNTRGDISFEAAFCAGTLAFNATDPVKSKDNKKLALGYFARLLYATRPMAEKAAYRAGKCHETLGNMPQACSAFQGYVKRFATGKFVDEAKSKLARLCAPPS